jgi:hypothetical protein
MLGLRLRELLIDKRKHGRMSHCAVIIKVGELFIVWPVSLSTGFLARLQSAALT